MKLEEVAELLKKYKGNSCKNDKLMLISVILGLPNGEQSCCRGMLDELSKENTEYVEIAENLFGRRSEKGMKNDRNRYKLYSCVALGNELVTKINIKSIETILSLEERNAVQYKEVLELLNKGEMTKKALYDYLDENVNKEESLYVKKNEILDPISAFIKKAKKIGTGKFSNSLSEMIKSIGIQLSDILSIWEKVPDVLELKKILKNKPKTMDTSTGLYF
ncbi:hypothetical protein [Sebaldella sp. S0638]|uniref:hypothetical protein n=1 Tax=Sebaldella sp. S0638 TaxID=2957809 RepID=UPI00209CD6E1|nr:hypothetical protein [Sebaldella sp. S0638]MCP1226168.1 hypothetical protein [Sebaldella sp. S0638]